MSTARERRETRRHQREAMVSRPNAPRQISTATTPRRQLPKLPFKRWMLAVPLAVALVVAVMVVLGSINPPDDTIAPNAIWLEREWTYRAPSDAELTALAQSLKDHQIGYVYAFTSSLKPDNTWAGVSEQTNRWNNEAEPLVAAFVERLRAIAPTLQIYAWIEVVAELPDGYRLDSPQVQRVVSDFAGRMVNTLSFDGVLVDVKPIFDGNEDLLVLLRAVRGSIGLETPLAVSVPADLTPSDINITLPSIIAPNTVWSEQYKQRVSLQADQMIVTAYNSYLDNPVDYIFWVAYQVESFTKALSDFDTNSQLLVSIPNYTAFLPAHRPNVESMAGALDGIVQAIPNLTTAQRARLQGIAIFTDTTLTDADWQVIRAKWLDRPVLIAP